MTEEKPTETTVAAAPPRQSRRFLRRLLLGLMRLFLIVLLLAAIGAAGWFGYLELDRSFDAVTSRIDANRDRIASLRQETDNLTVAQPSQDEAIANLATAVPLLDQRLTDVEEETAVAANLATDLLQQNERLTIIEQQLSTILSATATLTQNVATLNGGLFALQGDLNTTNSNLDSIGGQVDGLGTAVTGLTGNVDQLSLTVTTTQSETLTVQETLMLFRLWEVVARARLRLIENNFGLAQTDSDRALTLANTIATADTTSSDLSRIIERLTLVTTTLPNDPETAARDLETAWEIIDTLLTAQLFPDLIQAPPITNTTTITPTTN